MNGKTDAVTLWRALTEHGVARTDIIMADLEGDEFPIFQKYFAEAPQRAWPRAVVLEEFGYAIECTGGGALELLIKAGYRIVDGPRPEVLLPLG